MGKTRDLFKKIRDTKGTFHAKMGSIKDRNGMNLREAEDIKKRCFVEFTQRLNVLMYRTVLWTLWERERVGRFGRMAVKHVKYHV